MNFQSWYTDTVDVFRVRAVTEHGLTRHERTQVLSAVPCRVYRSDSRASRRSRPPPMSGRRTI